MLPSHSHYAAAFKLNANGQARLYIKLSNVSESIIQRLCLNTVVEQALR